MAKFGKFIHTAEFTGETAITTAYLASGAGVAMPTGISVGPYGEGLVGTLSHLLINFTGGAGNTKLTAFFSTDVAGDDILVPETEMPIVYGRATAGTGGCAARLDVSVALKKTDLPTGNVYLWVKTDAAGATLTRARLFWEE